MSKAKSYVLKSLTLSFVLISFAALRATAAEGAEYDVKPVPVKTPPPEFPSSMARDGIAGVVALKVEIDETGAVTSCAVAKSSNVEFDKPAMNAVKNWKFKPAQKGGAPVKVSLVIPIRFDLES